jgi:hypothetical protein
MISILIRFVLFCVIITSAAQLQAARSNDISTKISLADTHRLLQQKWEELFDLEKIDFDQFIMPDNHPAKSALDDIFSRFRPLASASAISKAGFSVVSERPSTMRVLSHPSLDGYLVKLYPLNEKNNYYRSMLWAVKRCLGAENIRKVIKQQNLKHISVPKKWIYYVPDRPALESQGIKNYVALLVERMDVVPKKESRAAWLNASSEVIEELYQILSRGYSSCYLPGNIPYTYQGKFSCLDTENPERQLNYGHVKKHLSPSMQRYWDKLVRQGGDTTGFWLTE